ncbi:hypothetical protein ACT17_02820 [Mycolicibacterium conceptionense]|jgi:hypothetical protein|uniref:Halobacterial output domain-containing protein n=2 Tax=Mycolicibacterium TaxID=1866885 RepID=A0ABR5FN24_9MYCO|nr:MULTISPECIES: hypothetical protein [Mycolicibacterium]KLI07905.1 hypothetical protein AA982_12415 [Mycolicibacterium senegalense]KLO48233.1 hypothetical protein ABW05_26320 [Mycolicibacterium senegalense]KMV20598.1 hypothetical protein ACT17_02820 [Mycolicibacterium conceptionense]OBJ97084.1 hypothetical protein A5639_30645 [Mycolicibacterium conceptionense]OMB68185.1 hypothetical protein A5741_09860 [Mycolicibacterium conceptionense]
MSDDNRDERDPLRAAFTDHQRAPRDVVPRAVEHTVDDLRRLADGTAQVQVTHYEITADGITKQTEWVGIAQPISINNRKES